MVEARLFQALSDTTRLKILSLLAREPMNVSRMVAELGYAQPAVSRHLRVLREVDLIQDKRRGKEVEYSLNQTKVGEAAAYLENLVEMVPAATGAREAVREGDPPAKPKASKATVRKVSRGKPKPEKRAQHEEPEYAIERKDDDGMDDFLL
jgi:DNA-binding transcriptional ArsR family regulator